MSTGWVQLFDRMHQHTTPTLMLATSAVCLQISVYTYGAPRAGNHRFARTYMRAVPDTWHIIHDQVGAGWV
jgi:hypothetical protein